MSMMTSQILKSLNFIKHINLDISRKKHYVFSNEKFIDYTSRATLWQNSFVAEVTFRKHALFNKFLSQKIQPI